MKKSSPMRKIKLGILVAYILVLSSCNAYFNQPFYTREAKIGEQTQKTRVFNNFPKPAEPVVVALYKFRDQTGQYKQTEFGSSWSTAVTQGATSILMKALEESNWFIPIEREGLSNLLNERKIIRSSRQNYEQTAGVQEPPLPPLLFAGIILEGGIISYDYNILTGGMGARYLGIGASGEYREDRISIYLRAISTNSGRVLKSIYTTKTILSQQVNVSVFKYVNPTSLLEIETGFSFNEPTDIAVKEAIEKAVQDLIIEGVLDGLWRLQKPEDVESPIFTDYIKEKEKQDVQNFWGNAIIDRRQSFSLSFAGESYLLNSDFGKSDATGGGSFQFSYLPKNGMFFSFSGGIASLKSGSTFDSQIIKNDFKTGAFIFPKRNFTPYASVGVGLVHTDKTFASANASLGTEFLVGKNTGLFLEVNGNYMLNDNLDGVEHGNYNDYFWGAKLGISFYLNFKNK
jgi:curli production assembly/transport component CsgG